MQRAKAPWFNYRRREILAFYILIFPFISMLFAVRVFPLVWGFVMSLTNFTGWNLNSLTFVGLDNFLRMSRDPFLGDAVKSTLIIVAFMVPVQTFISFSYALLLNNDLKGSGFYRAVFYMPAILPIVVTTMVWKLMFTFNGGVISNILLFFGLNPINWLGVTYQRSALFIMLMWSGGTGLLTYLAGLKNIPIELYESATIDGAGAWKKFLRITLPSVTPVLFFNVVNGMVASFQIFQQPVLLAQGRGEQSLAIVPAPNNYTYVVHAFQQFFQQMRFGYGFALIWVLFIVSVVVTRVIFYSQRYWVHYETDVDNIEKKKEKKRLRREAKTLRKGAAA